MQKAIWKFNLEVEDTQIIYMPKGAKILSVGLQQPDLCLWALVDTAETVQEDVFIEVYGTGNPITNNMQLRDFIGTVVAGRFVWHVFVLRNAENDSGE